MRLKLDENIHGDVPDELAGHGLDVHTVRDQGLAGNPDDEIASAVKAEQRCFVTFDLDFADPRRFRPSDFAGIVILRLRVPTAARQARRLARFFAEHGGQVEGRLWILDDARNRDWTPRAG